MTQAISELLQANLARVKQDVGAACARSGRDPNDVTLVGVTKYHSAAVADALVEVGITDIGENRLQVALPKFAAMVRRPVRDFIGPLQSNKVRLVLEHFDVLHSIDRLSVAEAVQFRAEQLGLGSVRCFVQVNISAEAQKGGFGPSQVFKAIREIRQSCPRLKLLGMMGMAADGAGLQTIRQQFKLLATLCRNAVGEGFADEDFRCLSMGMSGDFELAVEEGATHLRVGSRLYAGLDTLLERESAGG